MFETNVESDMRRASIVILSVIDIASVFYIIYYMNGTLKRDSYTYIFIACAFIVLISIITLCIISKKTKGIIEMLLHLI